MDCRVGYFEVRLGFRLKELLIGILRQPINKMK